MKTTLPPLKIIIEVAAILSLLASLIIVIIELSADERVTWLSR